MLSDSLLAKGWEDAHRDGKMCGHGADASVHFVPCAVLLISFTVYVQNSTVL